MNRLEATLELAKLDRVSTPDNVTVTKGIQDVAVKTHAIVAGIVPSALGFISKNDFQVVPRTSAVSATMAAVHSTWQARWFAPGNPLNLAAKAATLVTEGGDAVAQDLLHLGGSDNGYVITTAK